MENSILVEHRRILLDLSHQSIEYGIKHNDLMPINLNNFPAELVAKRACFVTLELNNNLRGCIGSLQAHRPLVSDVIYNAYTAAFNDPGFQPLTQAKFREIKLSISVLSTPEPIKFSSEEDLLTKIRPNIDGLILTAGDNSGTFLPAVWEDLPEKKEFLQNLKLKAGLAANYWSKSIKIERYVTESIT